MIRTSSLKNSRKRRQPLNLTGLAAQWKPKRLSVIRNSLLMPRNNGFRITDYLFSPSRSENFRDERSHGPEQIPRRQPRPRLVRMNSIALVERVDAGDAIQ